MPTITVPRVFGGTITVTVSVPPPGEVNAIIEGRKGSMTFAGRAGEAVLAGRKGSGTLEGRIGTALIAGRKGSATFTARDE